MKRRAIDYWAAKIKKAYSGIELLPIIGLAGKAGSGKSEVAKMLKKEYGLVWVDFATPIRDMLTAMVESGSKPNSKRDLIINSRWLTKQSNKADHLHIGRELEDIPARAFMQTLGTEWGRECIHPDLWVMILFRNMLGYIEDDYDFKIQGFVVDGVRFKNEFDFINALPGGQVFHVMNAVGMAGGVGGHKSETESAEFLDELPSTNRIINEGVDLDQLKEEVRQKIGGYINDWKE